MHIVRKKLIAKTVGELKKRIPFFSHWKLSPGKRLAGFAVDLLATAKFKNHTYRFCIEIKKAGYPQYIRDGIFILKEFTRINHSYYPLMAVPFISAQGKKICDEYNVGYIDFSGNVKIACGNIYISMESKERPKDAAGINQSLFSPKAARITKLLLSQPCAKWMQKDIAKRTKLSKGMVSRVINKMIEAGYVAKKGEKFALLSFDDLFSGWIESEIKRLQRRKNYYVWAQNPPKLMEAVADKFSRAKIKYAFTQEAGASLVAPFATFDIVSVYIGSLDKFPARALSATVADRGFNLTVIEAPDEYIFMNARDKGGLKVVDNLQLYADLKKNPLRGEKQANQILTLLKKESR